MIRVSTRGRYALRALLEVALKAEGHATSREEISARQAISSDYVAQLFRRLSRAGIVRSVRGPGGGYVLGRQAARITAGDVLRAVEGPLAVVHCVGLQETPPCCRLEWCVTHLLWSQLSDLMGEFLDSVTLQDLCEQARALDGGANTWR